MTDRFKESPLIPEPIIAYCTSGQLSLDCTHVELFRKDDGTLLHTVPGRIFATPEGQLRLSVALDSQGLFSTLKKLSKARPGGLLTDTEMLCMKCKLPGSDAHWESDHLYEVSSQEDFFPGKAHVTYRFREMWRGPRLPETGTIREARAFYPGKLDIPYAHVVHLSSTDGETGHAETQSLRYLLHFDGVDERLIVARIGGYTEAVVRAKTSAGISCSPEEVITQALLLSFGVMTDWAIAYYATGASQTIRVKEKPKKPWKTSYPPIKQIGEAMRCAPSMMARWYEKLQSDTWGGWDLRARALFSVLTTEQAMTEKPTQCLALGAANEAVARKHFAHLAPSDVEIINEIKAIVKAIEFLKKANVADERLEVDGLRHIRESSIPRIDGMRGMLSNPSAKNIFHALKGQGLGLRESEIDAWNKGRNLPAHGQWIGLEEALPAYHHMRTMLHKLVLLSVQWTDMITDYGDPHWKLTTGKEEPQGDPSDPKG